MNTNNDQAPQTEAQRDRPDVLADAVRVLTEAARLRRPVMHYDDEDGQWRAHPTCTELADWAEFVTQALAGAAANIGTVHAALAGRPGSWEADKLADLLHSTVGYDEQYLFEHRTEPLHVVVDVEQILTDFSIAALYDDAEAALDEMYGDALGGLDYTPYYWTYTRTDSGQFVADDPNAPVWSIEAWRASLAATEQLDDDTINELEQYVLNGPTARGASIVKSPEAARAADQLAEQENVVSTDFQARFDALTAQRAREWATYAAAFAANVRQEAARVYPGIPVHMDLRTTTDAAADNRDADDWDFYGSPETHLIDHATQHTPLPGSELAPVAYPIGTNIYAAETAAGRLPHLRLNASTNEQQERG